MVLYSTSGVLGDRIPGVGEKRGLPNRPMRIWSNHIIGSKFYKTNVTPMGATRQVVQKITHDPGNGHKFDSEHDTNPTLIRWWNRQAYQKL